MRGGKGEREKVKRKRERGREKGSKRERGGFSESPDLYNRFRPTHNHRYIPTFILFLSFEMSLLFLFCFLLESKRKSNIIMKKETKNKQAMHDIFYDFMYSFELSLLFRFCFLLEHE